MQGLSLRRKLLICQFPRPSCTRSVIMPNTKNAAGGNPPAAQRGDLVFTDSLPVFHRTHAAAGFVSIFIQGLQALIAVLRSYLPRLGIIHDLDHRRHRPFVFQTQLADCVSIAKDCPTYIALVISGKRRGLFSFTYGFIPFVIRIELPINPESGPCHHRSVLKVGININLFPHGFLKGQCSAGSFHSGRQKTDPQTDALLPQLFLLRAFRFFSILQCS